MRKRYTQKIIIPVTEHTSYQLHVASEETHKPISVLVRRMIRAGLSAHGTTEDRIDIDSMIERCELAYDIAHQAKDAKAMVDAIRLLYELYSFETQLPSSMNVPTETINRKLIQPDPPEPHPLPELPAPLDDIQALQDLADIAGTDE